MSNPAIIYCRFSPRPNPEDCLSNEVQEERARAYCRAYDYNVVAAYRDDAISGKDAELRPGLQQALIHVCTIKGVLIVYSISRFARGVIDGAKNAELIRKAGAGFVSITEHVDTTTPAGRCFYNIMLSFAQMERERIAEGTKRAMRQYQMAGRIMSKRLPYGYRRHPDKPGYMIPSKREQEHISMMKTWRAGGAGNREICRLLAANGITTRDKKPFHHTVVMRVLEREIMMAKTTAEAKS